MSDTTEERRLGYEEDLRARREKDIEALRTVHILRARLQERLSELLSDLMPNASEVEKARALDHVGEAVRFYQREVIGREAAGLEEVLRRVRDHIYPKKARYANGRLGRPSAPERRRTTEREFVKHVADTSGLAEWLRVHPNLKRSAADIIDDLRRRKGRVSTLACETVGTLVGKHPHDVADFLRWLRRRGEVNAR